MKKNIHFLLYFVRAPTQALPVWVRLSFTLIVGLWASKRGEKSSDKTESWLARRDSDILAACDTLKNTKQKNSQPHREKITGEIRHSTQWVTLMWVWDFSEISVLIVIWSRCEIGQFGLMSIGCTTANKNGVSICRLVQQRQHHSSNKREVGTPQCEEEEKKSNQKTTLKVFTSDGYCYCLVFFSVRIVQSH